MKNKNRGRRKILAVIITIPIAIVSLGMNWTGKSPQAESQEWWLNVPSSPLEIRFSPSKRDMELFNRSSGHVTEYRLGCVREVGQSLKVLRKLPLVETNLETGKVLINSVTVYTDSVEVCTRDKAKLAVVEVSFRDGSIWRVK
jgi:hypothetical protein